MFRTLALSAAAALLCAGATASADDTKTPPQQNPGKAAKKIDKAKLFARLDADGDGKLTREEFKKFAEHLRDRLKEKGKGGKRAAGPGEKLFDQIDANKDGVITLDEFEKFQLPRHAAGKGKGGPGAAKKE